jgi:hypothetical protein
MYAYHYSLLIREYQKGPCSRIFFRFEEHTVGRDPGDQLSLGELSTPRRDTPPDE